MQAVPLTPISKSTRLLKMIRLLNASWLIFVACATFISPVWSQSPESTVRVEPAEIQASAGEAVQVTIEIDNVMNLGAFQFDLTYDPAIVEIDNIALGDFAGGTGRSMNPLGPKIEAGKALFGAFSFGDAAGPDGSGTLAVVTLKAQTEGQTSLSLENVQVVDVRGGRITVSTVGATMMVSGSLPAAEGAASIPVDEPTRGATATAETILPSPEASAIAEGDSASSARDWLVVGIALVGVVVLAVLAAHRMTR
jgi:hypothetical protein